MTRFLIALMACSAAAAPVLPPMFGDHMVIQHGRAVPVWGWADAGEEITVTLAASSARTTAAPDGRWRIDLPAQKPGGPLTLVVAGKSTLRFRDVLVGEVWVASGQSNMNFTMGLTTTAAEDLPAATDPELRLFTVPRASALTPQRTFAGAWRISTPESARPFSAVAWYFARELRRNLQMPVGVIQTSWSGSIADEWTDPASLRSNPDFAPILERWRAAEPGATGYLEKPLAFDLQFEGFQLVPQSGGAPVWFADFRRDAFRSETGGTWQYGWDAAPRAGFEIGGGHARLAGSVVTNETAQLSLSFQRANAPMDAAGFTGIRFRHRGSGPFRVQVQTATGRFFAPPLQAGPEWTETTIAFADLRGFGPGGRQPFDARAVTGIAIEPGTGREAERVPSGLYHAMLCPLMPYAARGVLWYQGEGNSGRAWQYRQLLPAMIGGWREAWGQGDLPFVIVQLPFYRQRREVPSEGEWAELREAQLMTYRKVRNIGLVVTIDTGDAGDPHPRDKRPVGERAAKWVLGDVYARGGVYSGPLYESAAFESGRARIRFRFAKGLRPLDGAALRGFAIAGEDRKFVWADAAIDGDTVVVSSPQVPKPAAVRYAWADNPDCNLGNAAGLPASPFRTDDWPGRTTGKR